MEIAIGVLASLFGVVVGGALQHITSQRALTRQHSWERSRFVHEKLELIAHVSADLSNKLISLYLSGITAVESGERYSPGINLPFAKLEMLLDFYGPELKLHFKQLISLRDDMSQVIADLISGRLPNEKSEKQKLNGELLRASFKAQKICEELIASASRLGRESLQINTAK